MQNIPDKIPHPFLFKKTNNNKNSFRRNPQATPAVNATGTPCELTGNQSQGSPTSNLHIFFSFSKTNSPALSPAMTTCFGTHLLPSPVDRTDLPHQASLPKLFAYPSSQTQQEILENP